MMLEGVFEPGRFLSLVRDFIVFEDDGSGALVKKMAGYHQFHAVLFAVEETLRAARLQRAEGRTGEAGRAVRGGSEAGRSARRPAHRGGVAHARVGQEPDHGLLHGGRHPRAGDGEPNGGGADGPERPGRPAIRDVLALPGPAAPAADPGGEPRGPAGRSSR